MKIKDVNLIIKRRVLDRRNIIFIFVTVILIVTLLFCVKVYHYMAYEKGDSIARNSNYRILEVYQNQGEKNDFDKINKIEGVVYNKEDIHYEVLDTKIGNMSVEINVQPLLDKEEVKIVEGRNIISDNEAICAHNLYPYGLEKYKKSEKIDYFKSKDLIGNNLSITNELGSAYVKVVGSFDAFYNMKSINTCFVSENLKNLSNNSSDYRIVKVKNYSDINEVANKIKDLGFKVHYRLLFTENNFRHIPIFVSIITLIIAFYIILNYLKKKLQYKITSYGILKAVGYKDKDIFKIEFLENFVILSFCFIVSMGMFYIIYNYVLDLPFLKDFIFSNEFNYKIPYIGFMVVYLVIILLEFVLVKILLKKYVFEKNIGEILEDK